MITVAVAAAALGTLVACGGPGGMGESGSGTTSTNNNARGSLGNVPGGAPLNNPSANPSPAATP